MADRAPQSKQDEQYPLLKVAGGAGDGGTQPQNTTAQVTPEWGVAGIPKQSWIIRWPEFISTCWMSVIIMGMSFLIFYGVYMGGYRQQPVVVVKCNNSNSRPASDVFYHDIIPRDNLVPFMRYSEYLSRMAMHYPHLRFNVFFLIDDSVQTATGPGYNRFLRKLIPYHNGVFNSKAEENIKRDIKDFKSKYQNVNITVMSLSRYMATTPLKYKWRTIPISYLPFYARIYSVWQHGGIGIDLNTFNNLLNNLQRTDCRVSAILKQHNDGIKPEEYTKILNRIDKEEQNAIFQTFYGLVNQIMNETRSFFNKTLSFSVAKENNSLFNEPLIRTHRNKRDIKSFTNNDSTNGSNTKSINNEDLRSFVNDLGDKFQTSDSVINTDNGTGPKITSSLKNKLNDTEIVLDTLNNFDFNMIKELNGSEVRNISKVPQVVLFYDFTLFSDGIGPSYLMNEPIPQPESKQRRGLDYPKPSNSGKLLPHLSIDPEGMFVSAVSRLHPFLGHIITAGCQRMSPKFAIQDALITQCSGLFKEDVYCNNIYLL